MSPSAIEPLPDFRIEGGHQLLLIRLLLPLQTEFAPSPLHRSPRHLPARHTLPLGSPPLTSYNLDPGCSLFLATSSFSLDRSLAARLCLLCSIPSRYTSQPEPLSTPPEPARLLLPLVHDKAAARHRSPARLFLARRKNPTPLISCEQKSCLLCHLDRSPCASLLLLPLSLCKPKPRSPHAHTENPRQTDARPRPLSILHASSSRSTRSPNLTAPPSRHSARLSFSAEPRILLDLTETFTCLVVPSPDRLHSNSPTRHFHSSNSLFTSRQKHSPPRSQQAPAIEVRSDEILSSEPQQRNPFPFLFVVLFFIYISDTLKKKK